MESSNSSGEDLLSLVGAVVVGAVVVGIGLAVLPFILGAIFVGGLPALVLGGAIWVITVISKGSGS